MSTTGPGGTVVDVGIVDVPIVEVLVTRVDAVLLELVHPATAMTALNATASDRINRCVVSTAAHATALPR